MDPPTLNCPNCRYTTDRISNLNRHQRIHNRQGTSRDVVPAMDIGEDLNVPPDYTVQRITANPALVIERIVPQVGTENYTEFLADMAHNVALLVQNQRQNFGSVKYHLRMTVEFLSALNKQDTQQFTFTEKACTTLAGTNVFEQAMGITSRYEAKIDEYTESKSGWVVKGLVMCDLYIMKLKSSRALAHFRLPPVLQNKKAIINVQNRDNRCFMWCILAALHIRESPPEQHHHMEKPSLYRGNEDRLRFEGLQFPIALTDIPEFERQNNLRIIVYGYETNFSILYIPTDRTHPEQIIQLIFVRSGRKTHYCLVKDLNKLLNCQTKHTGRKQICMFCLLPFTTPKKLQTHLTYCTTGEQRQRMPSGEKLRFKDIKNQMWSPLVIVADFECYLKPVRYQEAPPQHGSYTRNIQKHVPNSFGFVCIRHCGCESQETVYDNLVIHRTPENPVEEFLEQTHQIAKAHQAVLDETVLIDCSPRMDAIHFSTTNCYICSLPFKKPCRWHCDCDTCRPEKRVKEHCHICGSYRGAAHSRCNFEFVKQRTVTVVLHNLRRYDSHLIAQKIGSFANRHNLTIECIPKTTEDYLTFSLKSSHTLPKGRNISWSLRFVDSFQFLPSSLANLVDILAGKTGIIHFPALAHFTPDRILANLLLRKGVYPYDMVTGWEVFGQTQLPTADKFFNKLTDEAVSEEDYAHAQAVWSRAGCAEFGDYHDLYLKTDVLQLADIFQNFRLTCMNDYDLDPAHYISLPSFAWSACLRMTGVELDLVTDPETYQFFEQGIRGGVSVVSHRYAKANNPYMGGEYVKPSSPTESNTFIMYYDANNLYGWSMSQYHPMGDFRWLDSDELEGALASISTMKADSEEGLICEVDMEFPPECHDALNDYPPAPERMAVPNEMLSDFARSLLPQVDGQPKRKPSAKLIPNLLPKTNYIVHYLTLQYYIQLGAKVTGIHRAISFRQGPWLRPWVTFNTEKRKRATTDFHKDFYKLAVNAVYGKSMENIRSYIDLRLVTTPEALTKLTASPKFKHCVRFHDDLIAVSMERDSATLNKPIYTGFSILEVSKLLMYRFHYEYIREVYGDRAKLLLTDTDSFIYLLETDDVFNDMAAHSEKFDTSDYPAAHPLYSPLNKKVIGKFKDELSSKVITEFIGLRSKMYSVAGIGGTEIVKKAKGVKRCTVKNKIRHEDYRKVLTQHITLRHSFRRFESRLHRLHTIEQNKISLCSFDDKRWMLSPDGIKTLAYGHHRCSVATALESPPPSPPHQSNSSL